MRKRDLLTQTIWALFLICMIGAMATGLTGCAAYDTEEVDAFKAEVSRSSAELMKWNAESLSDAKLFIQLSAGPDLEDVPADQHEATTKAWHAAATAWIKSATASREAAARLVVVKEPNGE